MASIENALVSLFPVGIGALIAWNGWRGYADERKLIERAQPVQAEIVDVGVSGRTERRDVDDGGTTTVTTYVPKLTFKYTVDGESYTSGHVEPPAEGVDTTHNYSSRDRAREHFEYEEGQAVTAHVDPERPGEAFLERETHTARNLALVGLGGVVAAFGVAGVLYSLVFL